MNKLIIFALIAIIGYHFFLKEGFHQPQKTNCSLYIVDSTCKSYADKGCMVNNSRTESNPDFCICDPSKCTDKSKCCEKKENKVRIAYDKLFNAYNEYQKNKSSSNRQRWTDAWNEYKTAAKK